MRQNISIYRWLLSGLLLTGLCFAAAGRSLGRADAAPVGQVCSNPIAKWDYNDQDPLLPPSVDETVSGTATMSAGIDLPAPTFLELKPAGTNYAVSFSGWENRTNPNKYIEFAIDTTGRNAIQLYFYSMITAKGPYAYEVAYSVDGITYKSIFADLFKPHASDYAIDFTTIKGLNNNPNAHFRLYAYSLDSNATWSLDNIYFMGQCATVFETLTPTPTATPATTREVIISEVAWMGTLDSDSDEWIELYNPGANVVLSNWSLKLLNDYRQVVSSVTLSGSLASNHYYLLARHDDDIKDSGGNNVMPDTLLPSSFAMGNTSGARILELWDETDPLHPILVDTANYNGGAWPAGSLSEKCGFGSMERVYATVGDYDFNWVTNTAAYTWTRFDSGTAAPPSDYIHGTPGEPNWIFKSPLISSPTPVSARSVVISEVAWAGTVADSGDEWIELQNPTMSDVDLRGWSLRADDSTPTIALDGTILAGSFFLIVHKNYKAVIDVNGNAMMDLLYEDGCSDSTRYLNNNGETLRLYDPGNNVVDTANVNGEAWPAGSTSSYRSMERRGPLYGDANTSWITNTGVVRNGLASNKSPINGTPKKPNWAFSVTPTPLVTPTLARTSTPVPQPGPVLVINEILPRPGSDWNNDGRVDVYDEFIEVINAGTVDLNLSSYKLDDYELDADGNVLSNAFSLPSKVLKPGEKAVFYGSQTGILLDDSGDTVRLIRTSGNALVDAYTYPIAKALDVSICRYADAYGSWIIGCFPTPGLPNALTGERPVPVSPDGQPVPACFLPDTVPVEFVLAECGEGGIGIWNSSYWDSLPGEGDEIWRSDEENKWPDVYE